MTRIDIEAKLRNCYRARAANDAKQTAAIFAPDAVYRVAGNGDLCPAVRTVQGDAIPAAMDSLCQTFRAKDWDVVSLSIEGARASVLSRATFEYTPTGHVVSTELAHFWTFQDGQATEVVEFCDTAHVAHLVAQAG